VHLHGAHHWWLSHDPDWPEHVESLQRDTVVHVNVSMPKQPLQDVLEEGWSPLVVLNKMKKISDFKFEELLHHRGSRKPPDSPLNCTGSGEMTWISWCIHGSPNAAFSGSRHFRKLEKEIA
jgi:hypothetical protein